MEIDLGSCSETLVWRTSGVPTVRDFASTIPSAAKHSNFRNLWLPLVKQADRVPDSLILELNRDKNRLAEPRWRNWQTRMIQVHVSVMDVEVRLLSGALSTVF